MKRKYVAAKKIYVDTFDGTMSSFFFIVALDVLRGFIETFESGACWSEFVWHVEWMEQKRIAKNKRKSDANKIRKRVLKNKLLKSVIAALAQKWTDLKIYLLKFECFFRHWH